MNLDLESMKRSLIRLEGEILRGSMSFDLVKQPRFDAIVMSPRVFAGLDLANGPGQTVVTTLFGMEVIRSDVLSRVPRMQLDPQFAALMPAEWVAETNAWMAAFFGYKEIAYLINRDILKYIDWPSLDGVAK